MFKAVFSAVMGGSPMSWLALALGAALVLGGAFGTGYYMGDSHAARIVAMAQAGAVQKAAMDAQAAQAKKDAQDYSRGVADGQQRQARLDAADVAAAKEKAPVVLLNPPAINGKCPDPVIPKAAMQRLNDPALIGGSP